MKRACYDIETMSDFFSVTFLDYDSDEVIQFEISRRKNQLKEIKEFLSSVKYLIGFNSIDFDNIVLQYIVENDVNDVSEIYKVSQLVIKKDSNWEAFQEYKKYSKWKNIQSIDLFLYWSKGLRLSKKLSLKYFAVNLDEEVLEMPIHHSKTNLTEEEAKIILSYNLIDCRVTKSLAIKLKEEINLRILIKKEYKLECLSYDAPKIASEILLKEYCASTKENIYEKRKFRYVKPYEIRFVDVVPSFEFKHEVLQQVYSRLLNAKNTFNEQFFIKNPNGEYLKISIGVGGIHSVNKNQKYIEGDYEILTADIASMYPQNILNYKLLDDTLLPIYEKIRNQRIVAKKNKDKVKDKIFKLLLNSTSGLLDSSSSWMYSPERALTLRLSGQLQLLALIEMFLANGINVISTNTDGVDTILNPNQKDLYFQILEAHSKMFHVVWETKKYKQIHFLSVNDYIAVLDDGSIKQTGMFLSNKILDGSNEFLIIPIALKEYFVNHIPIAKTIRTHENVYDFVSAKKIAKNYKVFYRGNQVQQLNRFFVSDRKNGAYLYKQKEDKTTMENVLKETPVYILNEKTNKKAQEFPIDFLWYINKAQEVINTFEPKQMTLF